jgi:hypothetical protein
MFVLECSLGIDSLPVVPKASKSWLRFGYSAAFFADQRVFDHLEVLSTLLDPHIGS